LIFLVKSPDYTRQRSSSSGASNRHQPLTMSHRPSPDWRRPQARRHSLFLRRVLLRSRSCSFIHSYVHCRVASWGRCVAPGWWPLRMALRITFY